MTITNTQKKQIKTDLLAGKSISPMQALKNYGCFRLGARIYELREEGMDIKTTMVQSLTNPRKKYAVYRMSSSEPTQSTSAGPVTPNTPVTPNKTSLWSKLSKIINIFK